MSKLIKACYGGKALSSWHGDVVPRIGDHIEILGGKGPHLCVVIDVTWQVYADSAKHLDSYSHPDSEVVVVELKPGIRCTDPVW